MFQKPKNIELKTVLGKIRNYEVKLRKAVSGSMVGEIKSLAKGSGLEFDDVRPYSYGDDIRAIDWNVSAKGLGTYIKTFKEDKDQTVWILHDLSHSNKIGKEGKYLLSKELASVLALSVINQGSATGIIGFTDQVEYVFPPVKSKSKGTALISRILKYQEKGKGTNLSLAISKVLSIVKRKSLLIVISDFIDQSFLTELKLLSFKHEVILVKIASDNEFKYAPLGIVPVKNSESGRLSWAAHTFFGKFGVKQNKIKEREDSFSDFVKKSNVDLLTITAGEDYIDHLIAFFKKRNRK